MLELGGKSAAVILDDMDIETAARTLSSARTAWVFPATSPGTAATGESGGPAGT